MDYQIEKIRHRLLKKNKNWIAIIVGQTGSGKSLSAISLAAQIDSNFSIKRVVFNSRDFMRLLRAPEGSENYLEKGSCVVYDEAGVGAASRQWFSIQNKMLSFATQTFRARNVALILTVPDMNYVDSQIRGLIHTFIETIRINRAKRLCWCKWFWMQNNPKMGKIYYHSARTREGKKIRLIGIKKPGAALVHAYEEKKRLFCETLNEDISEKLVPKKEKHGSFKEQLKMILRDLPRYTMMSQKGKRVISHSQIVLDFGVGRTQALALAKFARERLEDGNELV